MKKFLKVISLAIIIYLILVFIPSCKPATEPPVIKNVILMIGDGMGDGQIEATKIYYGLEQLHMETLPYQGYMTTQALFHDSLLVTDSAAAATAMATGHKTFLRLLGMGRDVDKLYDGKDIAFPYTNVTEVAISKGFKTGIVATKALYDATPAGFSAHVSDRGKYEEIARQQIASGIDVLMGAGYTSHYLPRLDSIQRAGYQVATTKQELDAATGSKLFAGFDSISPGTDITLEVLVDKALKTLHNEKGFFAMFEGSKIDSAGHARDMEYLVRETLSFDNAVGIVLEYIKDNPDTLLIVTADHETGDLRIPEGTTKETLSNSMFRNLLGSHTETPVPYFMVGPLADTVPELIDNTDIAKLIAKALGGVLN